MNENIKIFGVGLNKTGTKTLAGALMVLGYTNGISWVNNYLMDIYDRWDINFFLSMSEKYTFFDDIPWALLYKELHEKYPEAYFILTTRKDSQTWHKSHCKHILAGVDASYSNSIIYGAPDPRLARKKFISYYEKHNSEVRAYFKDNPNFIEVCWEKGDEWKQLCHLLKKEIPQKEFPYLNRRVGKKKKLKEQIMCYLTKKKEIKTDKPSKYGFSLVENIETKEKTVIIEGVYVNEKGCRQIHKSKLMLSDGISVVSPALVESVDRPYFNTNFPYIQKGEKIGFVLTFIFNYEISPDSEFTIKVDENFFTLPFLIGVQSFKCKFS